MAAVWYHRRPAGGPKMKLFSLLDDVRLPTTLSPSLRSGDTTAVHSPWIVPGVTPIGAGIVSRTTITVLWPPCVRTAFVGTSQLLGATAC